jgi:hypothetical protein
LSFQADWDTASRKSVWCCFCATSHEYLPILCIGGAQASIMGVGRGEIIKVCLLQKASAMGAGRMGCASAFSILMLNFPTENQPGP